MIIALLAAALISGQSAAPPPLADPTIITTQLGPTAIKPLEPRDPITARMDSNMKLKVAGPIGLSILARDLPIVGKIVIGGRDLWVVQFGAKNAYAVAVDDQGQIFSLEAKEGAAVPDPRVKPHSARITPLPR